MKFKKLRKLGIESLLVASIFFQGCQTVDYSEKVKVYEGYFKGLRKSSKENKVGIENIRYKYDVDKDGIKDPCFMKDSKLHCMLSSEIRENKSNPDLWNWYRINLSEPNSL